MMLLNLCNKYLLVLHMRCLHGMVVTLFLNQRGTYAKELSNGSYLNDRILECTLCRNQNSMV